MCPEAWVMKKEKIPNIHLQMDLRGPHMWIGPERVTLTRKVALTSGAWNIKFQQ